MKKLSTYFLLILFSFSAPSFADDISDFQIEGISIGDSLLDYMSKKEILSEIEINKSTYNYLTDGGGVRFRKAKNIRNINGFLFQDYVNYKPKIRSTPLDSLPILFQKDSLQIVSTIENKIIKIEIQ